jgi:hypothetical protein
MLKVAQPGIGRAGARGAALVEFYIVALFALLPFCMAILQTAVLLTAKNVLNHATFSAARAGAFEQASRPVMLAALARGLMPLHVRSAEEITPDNLMGVATAAYARAYADTLLFARLQIVNPSPEAFEDFAERVAGVPTIRNDSLEYRDTSKGSRSRVSIQEANILDIRVRYCQPLIFPLIDRLLLATLRRIDADAANQICYAAGRVPISARGVVHMQSDAQNPGA